MNSSRGEFRNIILSTAVYVGDVQGLRFELLLTLENLQVNIELLES